MNFNDEQKTKLIHAINSLRADYVILDLKAGLDARVLDFLPHSAHESRVLLATPNRSGLRPSFPAWPIRLLRLSALECLTSLADGMAYFALC